MKGEMTEKEYRWEKRHTSYQADYIWDKYGSGGPLLSIGNDDDVRRLLASSLSRVPQYVADKIIAKCAFIGPLPRGVDGQLVPLHHTRGRVLIVLSARTVRHPESEKSVKVVLHEIAHFHKRHNSSGMYIGKEEYERQEREAEALMRHWFDGGFRQTKVRHTR